MFLIGNEIYVRRFHAARLTALDHRTLKKHAAGFSIRTVRLPGQVAELYHLGDLQQHIDAARRSMSAATR